MKAEDINFTESLPLAVPVFTYNENIRERVFSKLFLFPPTKPSAELKGIVKNLSTGFAFMHYADFLNVKDVKILEREMNDMFGDDWADRLGFSKKKTSENIKDDNEIRLILVSNSERIPKYATWLNLMIELEHKLGSKIEYLSLSDMETGALILLDNTPIIGADIMVNKRDDKYNLPLYNSVNPYTHKNLLQPISLGNTRIVRCDDYNKLLTSFLFDEYQSETSDGVILYQQHLSILLPLLYPEQNFTAAIRQRLDSRSAFPSYYIHRLNSDETLRIEKVDKHINELYTFMNVKSVVFKYKLILPVSELYKNNKTMTENIFNAINTSEVFPISIISNKRGGTFTAKIFNEGKPTFNYMLGNGSIIPPTYSNSVALYSTAVGVVDRFIVEISDESELSISISNRSSTIITQPVFDRIFSLVSKHIVEHINQNKATIYPLYVDSVQSPQFSPDNIVAFSTHISTPFNLTLREFKKMCKVLSKSLASTFEFAISGDTMMLQDDFANSRITVKHGTTLSIHIRRLEYMGAYNIYVNLLLKSIAAWYTTVKKINKGTAKVSNIKLLKATDPARFDFEPQNPADKYSTRVQKTKQPVPMSIREVESKKLTPYRYVTLDNLSFPGKKDTYVCVSDNFPYIGFVRGLKKKYDICVPGCFKVDQAEKKSTSEIYDDCVLRSVKDEPTGTAGKELKAKSKKTGAAATKKIQSAFYIGKYDSQISTGKYYALPWEFNRQLDVDLSAMQSVIGKSVEMYAIYGGEPGGLVSLINQLLGVNFIADVEKAFTSNPSAFLKIVERFGDRFVIPDNYIEFLRREKEGVGVSHTYIEPMISLLYPDIGMFIILPNKDKHIVDFIGLNGITRRNVFDATAEDKKVKLFAIMLKDNIYSSIVHIKEKAHTTILNSDDKFLTLLRSFYNPDELLKYNPQHIPSRADIYDIVSSYDGKLTISISDDNNISSTIQIGNKTVVIYYRIPTSEIVMSDIKTVLKLLDELEIDIITAYRNKKNKLTHILAGHNVIIPIKPVSTKTYIGEMEIVLYEPIEMKLTDPSFPRELIDIVYDRHLERLAFIALNAYVRKQKNTSVRNKVKLAIKNKKIEELEKIKDLTYRDIMLIRDIATLRATSFKAFFDKIQFDFDSRAIQDELTDVVNIKKSVRKLLDELVVVRNKKASSPYLDNVVCKPGVKTPICYKNKLVVSSRGKKRIQALFTLILSNNEYMQEVLFNYSLPLVDEYTLNPNETIKTLSLA